MVCVVHKQRCKLFGRFKMRCRLAGVRTSEPKRRAGTWCINGSNFYRLSDDYCTVLNHTNCRRLSPDLNDRPSWGLLSTSCSRTSLRGTEANESRSANQRRCFNFSTVHCLYRLPRVLENESGGRRRLKRWRFMIWCCLRQHPIRAKSSWQNHILWVFAKCEVPTQVSRYTVHAQICRMSIR